MSKIPKNFPEYSLLYKTLRKRILQLKNELSKSDDVISHNKIIEEIEKYQEAANKLKACFPEGFFDDF